MSVAGRLEMTRPPCATEGIAEITHQRSVRYSSVMPTSARLALLRISPSSSASSADPALPSTPSLTRSSAASLACKMVNALPKCESDSSGDAASWARYRCGAGDGSGNADASWIDAAKC